MERYEKYTADQQKAYVAPAWLQQADHDGSLARIPESVFIDSGRAVAQAEDIFLGPCEFVNP